MTGFGATNLRCEVAGGVDAVGHLDGVAGVEAVHCAKKSS